MNAIELNTGASADFDVKLTETITLLQQVARNYAPATVGGAPQVSQASSLGAEDVVVSHLINSLKLDIGIFVLETGMLHPETLELLNQLKVSSRAPIEVFAPRHEAVVHFVAREGRDAMYKSIKLRKACCQIRKLEPLERALAGKKAWITGLRREQSYPSIGCAPCSRAISAGEDFRVGRWWWEDEAARECGLHVSQTKILEAEPA